MNGEIVLTSAYINFGEPLEQSLLKIAEHGSKFKCNSNINLFEYFSTAQSYHAKGLWFTPAGAKSPNMTVLGSSNFNERSRTRDLELNFLIVTQNERLQQQMNQEVEQILQNAQPLSISNMEMPEY